ncbi:MAG: hypothetical protein LQ347_003031 [Umbilicaria vellea]|nr:MAG: hypothetical protein LQ347_003031 [Umbilicaria vellea]
MDEPFEPTFGIELEFIVLYQKEDYVDADHEEALLQHMVDELKGNNFPVNNPHVDNIDNWTVSTDSTVELEQKELPRHLQGSQWYVVELKSPAYRYRMEALTEVQRAVDLVKKRFNIFVNRTCGFHVHVGNRDRGFTLETVKNLALLVTVFERQINQLHPRHRNSNTWCETPGMQFPSLNLWEVVEAIEAMSDIEDLTALMCRNRVFGGGSKFRAYNFTNLSYGETKTIEFRQHQGTMDTLAIRAWIGLTCRLVGLSRDAGPVGFIELVKECADKSNFTVIDLLYSLGFEDLGRYYLMQYYSTRSRRREPKGLWVEPSIGEWLTLSDGAESGSEKTTSTDGSGGSQGETSHLKQLYEMLDLGGDVTSDDVQIVSETSWKDI